MARRRTASDPPDLEVLLKGSLLREPSRGVLHRAFGLKSRLPEPQPSLAGWLVTLVFDSGLQPVPVGLRAAGAPERRVLYEARRAGEAAPRQVDLRLRREPSGRLEVLGQCLPPWMDAVVEVRSGRSKREAALSEAGEFVVRGIPARAGAGLDLTLRVGGRSLLTLDGIPAPEAGDARG